MKKLLTLTAIACATSFAAQAEVRINGFANLVGGITGSDDALYGYDDRISFSSESLFAIQVSGDINDKMTATGQIVAKGEDDYDPTFEWAYITYQATDNLAISAGRLRMPLFRYSASKDVGYSYHWVTAPRSVYDVGFNNIEGVRFDYSDYAGDWEYNFQAALGHYSSEYGGGTLSGDNVYLFSAEATNEAFKARFVYGSNKASYTRPDLDDLTQTLRNIGLDQLANDFAVDNDTGDFIGIGLEYDNFEYFINMEYTIVDTADSYSPEDTAYYVSVGMRTGKFTPSITYEKLDGNEPLKFVDQVNALPDPLRPPAQQIVFGVQQALMAEHNVITLGLRYDMDTNVALKADVSKYDDEINDDFDATLVRFAVNYVF